MANDCENRLKIHCDNERLLKKIHELFYLEDAGKIRYTMMKLVPIPGDKHDSEGNPLVGFFTPMGYWGTRSDFCRPKTDYKIKEFIFEYGTANGPNDYWIHELICSIVDMLNEFSIETKPKIYIKHLFDVCQVLTAGYMYWEPGMEMKYEYSTDDIPNETVDNEFKAVEEEIRKEMEVFEFHLEDYLEEEPFEADEKEFILPDELFIEMRSEFKVNTRNHDTWQNSFNMYCERIIDFMITEFTPYEMLAIALHSIGFYVSKEWKGLKKKVIEFLAKSDLKEYGIKDPTALINKIEGVNDNTFFEIVHVLGESNSVTTCLDCNIPMDTDNENLHISIDDSNQMCEPYEPVNPEWERFNKQLEKFSSSNQD